MNCPNCNSSISMLDIAMTGHDETNGLVVTFECNKCDKEFFAILTPKTFVEAE